MKYLVIADKIGSKKDEAKIARSRLLSMRKMY